MKALSFYATLLLGLFTAASLTACTTADLFPFPTPTTPSTLPTAPIPRPTPTLAPALQPLATPPQNPQSANQTPEALPSDISPIGEEALPDTVPSPPSQVIINPQPTATAIPLPDLPASDLLALAQQYWHNGDTTTAETILLHLREQGGLSDSQLAEVWYWLGRTAVESGDDSTAVHAFRQQLASNAPNPHSHFFLAELNAAVGNCPTAITEYGLFLADTPELGAYIWPRIATCTADRAAKITAYQQALTSEAHYLVPIAIRRQLANFYREDGAFDAAVAQYEAIRTAAQTPQTKGEMTYLIGSTYVLSGSLDLAYEAYQFGVANYPEAYESYLGLVALVQAEQSVDPYQRGLTNYHAKSYQPAVTALLNHIAQNPTSYNPEAHLFAAWSYEGLGDGTNALLQLEAYLATDPANPEVIGRYYQEKEALETRSISVASAIATLDGFREQYPDHALASWASWRTAVLADRFQGEYASAVTRYLSHATTYPQDENATEAQFRAGMLAWGLKDTEAALSAWELAAAQTGEWSRAAQVWLITALPAEEATPYLATAAQARGADYYTLRARDLGEGLPAYAPPAALNLADFDETAARLEVEQWIRTHFGLAEDATVQSELAPGLANDPRVIRGTILWQIGLYDEAKRELEAVRLAYADNAQLSYQLALYFRDLGLYRSSILAAVAVLTRAGVTVYEAPRLIGRLAYPVYYNDLLVPLADQYGYDPLLHFALLRQESLFEGFATSTALAQGLGQVIPATGEYIALKLGWPNYVNEDLYRPYINLAFAAFYLDEQLRGFEGNTAAALAAYNAGPGNAIRWRNQAGDNHDLYLETVNFNETRLYIRNIYVWHAAYRYLYSAE